MTTSLNDTVFAVQKALEENYTALQEYIRQAKRPSRIPFKIRKLLIALTCDYGRSKLIGKLTVRNEASPNIFTPTDKVFPDTRIAVYTVLTGGYDSLHSPIYVDDDIDYYAFTDSDELIANSNNLAWNVIKLPSELDKYDNARKNRCLKINHDYALSLTGKKYDYCIYVDSNCRIACDIKPLVYSLIDSGKNFAVHRLLRDSLYDEAAEVWWTRGVSYKALKEQMNFYEAEGFPKSCVIFENPILIRKCNDSELADIMRQWWEQVIRFTYRDQLSLPYVLWKNHKDDAYIFSLGNNARTNPYFIFALHGEKGDSKFPQM